MDKAEQQRAYLVRRDFAIKALAMLYEFELFCKRECENSFELEDAWPELGPNISKVEKILQDFQRKGEDQ